MNLDSIIVSKIFTEFCLEFLEKGLIFFGSISFLTPLMISVFGEKILAFKFVLAVETQEK